MVRTTRVRSRLWHFVLLFICEPALAGAACMRAAWVIRFRATPRALGAGFNYFRRPRHTPRSLPFSITSFFCTTNRATYDSIDHRSLRKEKKLKHVTAAIQPVSPVPRGPINCCSVPHARRCVYDCVYCNPFPLLVRFTVRCTQNDRGHPMDYLQTETAVTEWITCTVHYQYY